MTNSTIFVADKAPSPDAVTSQAAATAAQQTHGELVTALVGEGKKYKNIDDLAKAYINADDFIEQLKAENRELREKTVASKTVDDVLERLQQQQQTRQNDTSVDAPANGVSVADITKLVEQTVTGIETARKREGNLLQADKLMKEVFGDKAGEVYKASATTPEAHAAYMQLAAVNPEQFVRLFSNVPKNGGSQVDSGGSVSSTVSFNSGDKTKVVGTKDYYDNIRRTNPSLYYSQAFQVEMDKTVRTQPNLYFGK